MTQQQPLTIAGHTYQSRLLSTPDPECLFGGAAEILDYFGGSSCIHTNSVGSPSRFVADMAVGQPQQLEHWDIHP